MLRCHNWKVGRTGKFRALGHGAPIKAIATHFKVEDSSQSYSRGIHLGRRGSGAIRVRSHWQGSPTTKKDLILVDDPVIESGSGMPPTNRRAKTQKQRRESALDVLPSCYTGPLVHESGVASTAFWWRIFQVTQAPYLIPMG